MDIVTITFNQDLELCKYQLKSIRKFLEPCHLHIVINEEDTSYARSILNEEINKLQNVTVWDQQQIIKTFPVSRQGWYTQQVLKLLFPSNNDYVVLDCKDIFIRPTLLSDLKKEQHSTQPNVEKSLPWNIFYKELNLKLSEHYKEKINHKLIRNIQTPRLIRNDVKKTILKVWQDNTTFAEWFLNIKMPSEFILYDTIRLYEQIKFEESWKQKEIVGLWESSYIRKNTFNELPTHTKIVKIHRRILENKKTKKQVLRWFNTFLD
jgi:hypothetical protein